MSEFYIKHLTPTKKDAEEVIKLRRYEHIRNGVSFNDAMELANWRNKNHVNQQVENLAHNNQKRYLGIVALRSNGLIGYSDTGVWTIHDQYPFSSGLEKIAIFALIKLAGNRLGEIQESIGGDTEDDVMPFGIQELVVEGDDRVRTKAAEMLLERAIMTAESRKIYFPTYADETILSLLGRNGFDSTERCKVVAGDIKKELYIRPPYIRDESDVTGINMGKHHQNLQG